MTIIKALKVKKSCVFVRLCDHDMQVMGNERLP